MATRRLLLVGSGVAALVLCLGTVAAAPLLPKPAPKASVPLKVVKPISLEGIDPVFARQLTPRTLSKTDVQDLQKKAAPVLDGPNFNIKHLDAIQAAQLLGASDPAALPGPVRFDARTLYHDDATYMEILAYHGGHVGVRPLRNYLHFSGTEEVLASRYTRPGVLIHFRAQANTRYLMECAVAGSGSTNFYAIDARGEYSVRAEENATLLYLRDQTGGPEDVVVQINADRPGWYLDGCELTANPR